jgi:hypothetical protein
MYTLCGASIDWSATGEMLSGLGTIGGSIAILIAAWVGSNTFTNWKRQKLEERKIELAENVLSLSYKIEEAYGQIRFESYDATERDQAFENMRATGAIDDDTSIEERSRLLTPQVTVDRLIARRHLWTELAELTPVAKAIFGAQIADPLTTLRNQRGKIIAAAKGLAALAKDYCKPQTENALERMDERRDRYERIIWPGEPDNDPLEAAIKDAIAQLDAQLGPVVRSQG